jgi:hypothetical protein
MGPVGRFSLDAHGDQMISAVAGAMTERNLRAVIFIVFDVALVVALAERPTS